MADEEAVGVVGGEGGWRGDVEQAVVVAGRDEALEPGVRGGQIGDGVDVGGAGAGLMGFKGGRCRRGLGPGADGVVAGGCEDQVGRGVANRADLYVVRGIPNIKMGGVREDDANG